MINVFLFNKTIFLEQYDFVGGHLGFSRTSTYFVVYIKLLCFKADSSPASLCFNYLEPQRGSNIY